MDERLSPHVGAPARIMRGRLRALACGSVGAPRLVLSVSSVEGGTTDTAYRWCLKAPIMGAMWA